MTYRYELYSWIYPQSGFDLSETNRVLENFKGVIQKLFSGNQEALDCVDKIAKQNPGKIIDKFIIESEYPTNDPIKDLFPEIKKVYPEAIFITCQKISTMKLIDV